MPRLHLKSPVHRVEVVTATAHLCRVQSGKPVCDVSPSDVLLDQLAGLLAGLQCIGW